MKKIYAYILLTLMAISAAAQGKVNTKQYIVSDFPSKTLMVVLTSDPLIDNELRISLAERWVISPYEFCDREQFKKIMHSDDYYFLLLTEAAPEDKKAGLRFMSIYKGRKSEKAGLDGLFKVVSIPFSSTESLGNYQAHFVAAMLESLQYNIRCIIKRVFNVSDICIAVRKPSAGISGRPIIICRDDLAFETTEEYENYLAGNNILIRKEDELLDIVSARESNDMVCYFVSPLDVAKGSVTYTMIFDICSQELLYIRKGTCSAAGEWGITETDISELIKMITKK